ncbi:hypothetical protein [Cellulosilyticum ruminicola]|uniref:hypothetical protein n=1 Tax=Cellulosilyticum ruminicola TaxID=425254 RepID=UPI0038BC6F09
MASNWNISVEEIDDYYIVTPLTWNNAIPAGQSIEFILTANGDTKLLLIIVFLNTYLKFKRVSQINNFLRYPFII